jgi:hypothetical protein
MQVCKVKEHGKSVVPTEQLPNPLRWQGISETPRGHVLKLERIAAEPVDCRHTFHRSIGFKPIG